VFSPDFGLLPLGWAEKELGAKTLHSKKLFCKKQEKSGRNEFAAERRKGKRKGHGARDGVFLIFI
jgi:hypothetical protein